MLATETSLVDDDLYVGYNDYPSIYSTKDLDQDEVFQEALQTSYAKRSIRTPKTPGTAMRLGTSTGFHRRGTAMTSRPGTGPRPMTAVRGAGYTSNIRQPFDPLNMAGNSRGAAPPLTSGKEDTQEEKIKVAERKIMELIESSAMAVSENNMKIALERAREASSRERMLIRLQEQTGLSDSHNVDLTFAVLFNLAIQYTNNEMYTEAIATYQAITRNKVFRDSARLKVNMGNIYVKTGQLSQAIKMYRMSLDQATAAHKDLRIKIMHNIGMLFVQMGRLEEAASSFEWVMRERAEFNPSSADLRHLSISAYWVILTQGFFRVAVPRIKIMHNIGMLFVQMGRLEEAASSFEWVMRERAEFNPSSADLRHLSISAYWVILTQGFFRVAVPRIKIMHNIGMLFVQMGRLEEAASSFEWVMRERAEFNPSSADLRHLSISAYWVILTQGFFRVAVPRIKIMHNIGMLFVQMGRLEEAASSFEWVMRERAEFKAGLHAILCHFALSHRDKMKRGFLELLEVQLNIDQEDKYSISTDDVAANILNEVIKADELSKLEREMKLEAEKTILNAAKLIAPVIEDTLSAGFAWCVEAIRSSAHGPLAADLEINKAMVYLHNRETQLAIETLKVFENRETKANSAASTMLSFVYFLRGDYEQCERCAEAARKSDSYNAAAYVNLSACAIKKGEFEAARELLLCALDNDASHVQALYNLGLVHKKQNMYEEALECFWKVRNIARHDPQTLYQIGHLYQLMNDVDQAAEWYNQLLGIIPSDPGVLQKLGEMYDNIADKQQAYQYYSDSYRFYPANFEVIDWLGSYFISMQVAEKALGYFERAVELAPDQPRWRLLVAASLRRTGQFHKALNEYQDIHKRFPDNIECLKFLVRLCSDLGLKEAQTYANELKKAERSKELKERQGSARPGTTGSRRSSSGASSRGGSGLSMQSENRSSPVLVRKDNRGTLSSGNNRSSRISVLDSTAEISTDANAWIDAKYSDPVGPMPVRPMTSTGKRDDDFGDEELGDDLLPV